MLTETGTEFPGSHKSSLDGKLQSLAVTDDAVTGDRGVGVIGIDGYGKDSVGTDHNVVDNMAANAHMVDPRPLGP